MKTHVPFIFGKAGISYKIYIQFINNIMLASQTHTHTSTPSSVQIHYLRPADMRWIYGATNMDRPHRTYYSQSNEDIGTQRNLRLQDIIW